jgi:TatD DNase family protein
MKLIDTHAHLDYYENDEENLISEAVKELLFVNTISTKINEFDKLKAITEKYHNVYCSIGEHPDEVIRNNKIWKKNEIVKLVNENKKIIAIGETGLDYYRKDDLNLSEIKEKQINSFQNHLDASVETKKPLVIHNRNSDDDMVAFLGNNKLKYGDSLNGVIHSFTGDCDLMYKFLDLNFYISFSGIVTFKNAQDLQNCAKIAPLDRILIETDSPFLTPSPHRGKKNNPYYVKYVAEFISNIRQIDLLQFSEIANNNAIKLFKY